MILVLESILIIGSRNIQLNWIIDTSHITTCSTGTLQIQTKPQREREKKNEKVSGWDEPGHSALDRRT